MRLSWLQIDVQRNLTPFPGSDSCLIVLCALCLILVLRVKAVEVVWAMAQTFAFPRGHFKRTLKKNNTVITIGCLEQKCKHSCSWRNLTNNHLWNHDFLKQRSLNVTGWRKWINTSTFDHSSLQNFQWLSIAYCIQSKLLGWYLSRASFSYHNFYSWSRRPVYSATLECSLFLRWLEHFPISVSFLVWFPLSLSTLRLPQLVQINGKSVKAHFFRYTFSNYLSWKKILPLNNLG